MTERVMRTERDSMGEMAVPSEALWGASTQRAVLNFPIANRPLPSELIHAFGHLKAACAQVNKDLGKLSPNVADAIIAAANDVAAGKHDAHFPVDVFQTGSGTSTNMNANEVIATLASKLLGSKVHPNDDVNMGQSSNDTFPSAMHVAGALTIRDQLLPVLHRLYEALDAKAKQWDHVVKMGRTHLMDATPIRVGQVFAGYAQQARFAHLRATHALEDMRQNMPIGGTAVGTGINTHPQFGEKVCDALSKKLNLHFVEAKDHCEAQAAADCFVQAHANLKTIAVSLSKIANDIRLLGSGPRGGLGELQLPAIQPGSSIMPGKVNPVLCESVMQVACRVIGNDATITTAGLGGVGSNLELNVAMPIIVDSLLDSVKLLANVTHVFIDKLLVDLQVDEVQCKRWVEQSLMLVTSLVPTLGYDQAAALAYEAHNAGKTIREVVLEKKLMPAETLDALLDAKRLTYPAEG